MSNLAKEIMKNKLPPLYSGSTGLAARKINRRRDYTPVSWEAYYDTYKDVQISDGSTFRVYLKGSSGPLLLLLHGGGYSGLSWSLLTSSIIQLVDCQVAALDIRGHGGTHAVDEDDLSAERLSSDVGEVFNSLYGDEDQPPSVVLVGHSMGGAVAVHTVFRDLLPTAIGLVVIDVVEGTALDALQSMQSFLRSRPPSFLNLSTAIEWCVRSGQVRNVESAKVSMPGQLKNSVTGDTATKEIDAQPTSPEAAVEVLAPRQVPPSDSILEEEEEDHKANNTSATPIAEVFKTPADVPSLTPKYVWRIELSKTEKFWNGWFEGLSNMFLSTSIPKLLLLAGVDRLDKDLTIGQMQGKFQMQVLPQCGHAVHEDDPDKVAEAIATFLVRNKFTTSLCDFQRPHSAC